MTRTLTDMHVGADGHIYFRWSDGSVGHVECWCFHQVARGGDNTPRSGGHA